MLKIFPVFIVVLALGAREYVDLRVPGGLAYADRAAVVDLARETAIAWYEGAPPRVQRVLRRMFSNMDARDGRRSARRHRHSERLVPSSHSATIHTRIRIGEEQVSIFRREQPARRREIGRDGGKLRGFGQRDRSSELDQPLEITFVAPVEKASESARRPHRRDSRRRR